MAKPKENPAVEKAEEKFGDLDGDNEKGEAPAHQKKVAAADKKNAMASKKKGGDDMSGGKLAPNPSIPASKTLPKKGTNMPPLPAVKKGAGKGKGKPPQLAIPTKGKGKKGMCSDCTKKGMSSCSH